MAAHNGTPEGEPPITPSRSTLHVVSSAELGHKPRFDDMVADHVRSFPHRSDLVDRSLNGSDIADLQMPEQLRFGGDQRVVTHEIGNGIEMLVSYNWFQQTGRIVLEQFDTLPVTSDLADNDETLTYLRKRLSIFADQDNVPKFLKTYPVEGSFLYGNVDALAALNIASILKKPDGPSEYLVDLFSRGRIARAFRSFVTLSSDRRYQEVVDHLQQ